MTASHPAAVTTPPRAECRIDLSALRRNAQVLQSQLAGSAQLWAVVKANAYGHDVDRVAEELVAGGARRICVATLSEARHLRQAGLRVPMLVMGPLDVTGIGRAIDLDVSVSILSMRMIDSLEAALSQRGRQRRASVHLKVDTGMGRWGIDVDDLDAAIDRLLGLRDVEFDGVMTHFATADDLNDDGFFDDQLATFGDVVAQVRERVPDVHAHAANSAATLRTPDAHFDAVRCGVALYGLDPRQQSAADHKLQPVMSLHSHVADIRVREIGESTGYSRTWVSDTDNALVALVPIGYADGVRRTLANRGSVVIGGKLREIVGNVSMDHVSVLVDADVSVGDVVTVIGRDESGAQVSAEDHARWADTINYEITCGVAEEPRLIRTYLPAR